VSVAGISEMGRSEKGLSMGGMVRCEASKGGSSMEVCDDSGGDGDRDGVGWDEDNWDDEGDDSGCDDEGDKSDGGPARPRRATGRRRAAGRRRATGPGGPTTTGASSVAPPTSHAQAQRKGQQRHG